MTDLAKPFTPARGMRPFNSPLECGLRMLFVLNAANGQVVDLQRLVSLDYLLVHSGDVQDGPTSLHPAVPFRGGELLVKRDMLRAGLNQMYSRELIAKRFDTNGITYQSTELTHAFVALLKSTYAAALRERAAWVIGRFGGFSDNELSVFMSERVARWGAEFDRITAIDELEL